jgi:p-hydroxybenzoate 3-monooxygenase
MFELTGGRAVTVYAQHEVLKDLIARRLADNGDLRFGASDVQVDGITGEQPTITSTHDGQRQQLECYFVAGCDGSRTLNLGAMTPKRCRRPCRLPARIVR